ncbi:COG3014 family protein [Vibrio sp. AK197]
MRYRIQLVLAMVSTTLLTSCANFSAGNLFSHYSAQQRDLYQSVKSGQYQKAKQALGDDVAGAILDNFEQGRVAILNQDYAQGRQFLDQSDQAVREQQDKATISISESAISAGSLATNDNLNIYRPADYELGFLHLYLGLTYVYDNDLQGALVEMRRANQIQEQARKTREAELEAAQDKMQSQGLSPNLGSILANYPDAGKTLQAVQNGYLLYLSALLYEASGDLNGAYVDYRRALAVSADNSDVAMATMRVAKRLGMDQDLLKLRQRYGDVEPLRSTQSRVIIIEEQGVVDALQGWKQALPIFDSKRGTAWYTLALPYYPKVGDETFVPMTLNGDQVESSQLADVDNMASHDLSERMPSIILRQALRVVTKEQLRRQAAKDDVGNLLFNVWNTLTEQPDTRSWLTLPARANSATINVESGTQTLNIGEKTYSFDVEAGRTVLVWLSRQGSNATVWHKQLGRL